MSRGELSGPEGATSEELEPQTAFMPESEADESGEDSSDDESKLTLEQGGKSGAHQEVPAAVRKLDDSFTGSHQPITQSHTTSGRDAASLQAPMRAVYVNHLHPRSRPRSVKHRRPQNGQIGSARGRSKWTGNSRAKYGR